MKKIFLSWLFTLVIVSMVLATIYVAAHFVLRSSANDPQAQLANDTAWRVAIEFAQNGKATPLTDSKINLATSQAPFVILYDKNKQAYDSTALLDNKIPELPQGVLDHVEPGKRHTVTWQPTEDTRIAAVAVSAGDYGYVVSGRLLDETDVRIGELNKIIALSFASILVVTTIGFVVLYKTKSV